MQRVATNCGVSLDFIGVDWEVDCGVMDMMLSSIAPEVTRIVSISKRVLWDVTQTLPSFCTLGACHPKVFHSGSHDLSFEPEPGALPDCLIQMALSHVFITLFHAHNLHAE